MWRTDVYQMEFINPSLRRVLKFYEEVLDSHTVITSLYRIGDVGPHGQLPLRAVDLRYVKDESELAEQMINATWIYDPERPHYKVALLHNVGGGLHLHIQVHRNTRRRQAADE